MLRAITCCSRPTPPAAPVARVSLLVLNKDTTTNFNAQISLTGFMPRPDGDRPFLRHSAGRSRPDQRPGCGAGHRDEYFPAPAPVQLQLPGLVADALYVCAGGPAPGGLGAGTTARRPVGPPTPGPAGRALHDPEFHDLQAWTTVSTNPLPQRANLTNPVPAGAAISFWRAVWQP